MFSNKTILVTNDDGYSYPNLKALVEALVPYAKEIIVVAPFVEQSACSHAITIQRNLLVKKEEDVLPGVTTYSVNGTPGDCVRIALTVLNIQPDLVVSGINKGYNLACDLFYSGTVSAIVEAGLLGYQGIAFSTDYKASIDKTTLQNLLEYLEGQDTKDCLNINFPQTIKEYKWTIQAENYFDYYYEEKEDGGIHAERRINQSMYNSLPSDSDIRVVDEGNASITSLRLNLSK